RSHHHSTSSPTRRSSGLSPGRAGEPDGDVFHAALRVDGKREFRKSHATFGYYELRVTFYFADCLHLNKHGIAPLAHMAAPGLSTNEPCQRHVCLPTLAHSVRSCLWREAMRSVRRERSAASTTIWCSTSRSLSS